jgi:osmotically-inducible protein OsmY
VRRVERPDRENALASLARRLRFVSAVPTPSVEVSVAHYDRPDRPGSWLGRRGERRSDEAERGPWSARDPSELERGRGRGRDPYESDEEGGGYGEQGFVPRRRGQPFEEWQRDAEREFAPEPRIYGGTPAQQRGWERLERRGRFAGRGPKGYQRSDERIREDVCDGLTADPDIDAVEIVVLVEEGEVTLDGSVPDRRMKRDAEDRVEEISGVRQVHNRLRVESRSDSERSTTGAGGSSEAGATEGRRSTASGRQGS